ncbi:MAG: hypothetical protein HQL44_13815 [Alphaproteobacteria bacterium]|nr:hypothetical protein [Alphaproteobacteria bacterium]
MPGQIDPAACSLLGGAEAQKDGGHLLVTASPHPWAISTVWMLGADRATQPKDLWEPFTVMGTVQVHEGEAAFSLIARDETTDIDQVVLKAGSKPQPFKLNACALSDILCLALKATGKTDPRARVEIISLSADKLAAPPDDAVHAFYDLDWMPASFDLCTFLMGAEMMRAEMNLPSIRLTFVLGRDQSLRREEEETVACLPVENRHWRLDNLLIPMASLLPSVESVQITARREDAYLEASQASAVFPDRLSFRKLSLAELYQKVIPKLCQTPGTLRFRAASQGHAYVGQWIASRLKGRKPVTITLRQSQKTPERNSDIAAWAGFARSLDLSRYLPIIVPDTDAALAPPLPELAGFAFFTEAAFNLGLRMALYEASYLNLLTTGGPIQLCQYNDLCRYLYFKPIVSSSRESDLASQIERCYYPGQSPPHATRFQRWVWDDDRLEVIQPAFEDMCAAIEADNP